MLKWIFALFSFKQSTDITEEKIEEYKMLSDFKPKEIIRIRKVFLDTTAGTETMSKDAFVNIEGIHLNPLIDRICLCFGLTEESSVLDFQAFLVGLSAFNSPGKREQKLRIAFKIQDFDGDGSISRKDLAQYIERTTAKTLTDTEINDIVIEVFRETCSDPKQELLSFSDFQRIVAPLDFQAKLILPI